MEGKWKELKSKKDKYLLSCHKQSSDANISKEFLPRFFLPGFENGIAPAWC